MPRFKNNVKSYKIVSVGGRREYETYGAFPHDEEGFEQAEDFKGRIEDRHPHLDFEIIE